MAYRTAYDRIPCPGDITLPLTSANYGLEAGAGTGSTIPIGTGACGGKGVALQAVLFLNKNTCGLFTAAAKGIENNQSRRSPPDTSV